MFAILIGYPMAYAIARAPDRWRNILLMLVILPFWTSFLLRVYALSGFLRGEGVINNFLGLFGIAPLTMMQTDFAVYVGIVYTYLPFFILPLYTNLVKLDGRCSKPRPTSASRPWQTFLSVTLPLSMPGVIAGSMLVFIPAIGEFVIPSLLGGPGTQMIGRILWDEFFSKTNWPRAAALAITMLVVVVIPIMLMQRAQNAVVEGRRDEPQSLVPADRRDARLRLPLCADHFAGRLLVQREPAGDGLVGLLAPVLREPVATTRRSCRPPWLSLQIAAIAATHRDWCSARSAPSRWSASAASAARPCCRPRSRRRWSCPTSSPASRCCCCSSRCSR